jgi:surface antigen
MRWSGSSYIGVGRERQSPPLVRPVAVAILAAALGGCAGLGLPFGETASNHTLSTGSIQNVSAKGGEKVDQSDWEAVRRAAAGVASEGNATGTSEWRNPKTGSQGTVTVLDTVTATNDPNCRNFATTINDTRGIRHYRGETCRVTDGHWQLFGVLADDSTLL